MTIPMKGIPPVQKLIVDLAVPQGGLEVFLVALGVIGIEGLGLLLTDIFFRVRADKLSEVTERMGTFDPTKDVEYLIQCGMALYPAIILCRLEKEKQLTIRLETINTIEENHNMSHFTLSVFVAIFFIFITGSFPTSDDYKPQILKAILGEDFLPLTMVKQTFSCNLGKIDLKFIKEFPFSNLPAKFQNRIALSCAGYRWIVAFATCELQPNTPGKVVDLQASLKDFIKDGFYWDVHPVFRNPTIIAKYGSINKSLQGLLYEHSTEAWQLYAVKWRVIHEQLSPSKIDDRIFDFTKNDFNSDKIDLQAQASDEILEMLSALRK
jgi:hypothetical protein